MTDTDIHHDDVRALLDIIACSMDFGSGFLDTEQVVLLRRIAQVVGMDPEDLTPPNMPHTFEQDPRYSPDVAVCAKCQRMRDAEGRDHSGWRDPEPPHEGEAP